MMMATMTARAAGISQSFDRLLCRPCAASVMVIYGNWLVSARLGPRELVNQVQGSLPAGFGEEMQSDVAQPGNVVCDTSLLVLIFGSLE